ncbi:MAG: hypothetical protein OXJ52_06125 [Oligoflexia bacterium]|nr:hypothetical protein [Oligoflexia bacterium]
MKRLVLFLIFCASCQGGGNSLSNWWGSWKESAITYLASESAKSYLNEEERFDLLDLFDDLQRAVSCDKRQDLIEKNETLKTFGKQYDLPRGYLFDILFNYDYEEALTQLNRNLSERLAFTVVNVWKTSASLRQINQVVEEISKCYPKEYVD